MLDDDDTCPHCGQTVNSTGGTFLPFKIPEGITVERRRRSQMPLPPRDDGDTPPLRIYRPNGD